MRIQRIALGIGLLVAAGVAPAKPKHFQHVRAALVAKAARCTSCHTEQEGASLNLYGEQLQAIGDDMTLADRIDRLESLPLPRTQPGQPPEFSVKADADQDGVLNWVEILAGTSPADPENKPDAERAAKIATVVSCNICHLQTGIPGKRGLEGNPHNELGRLLLKTFVVPKGDARPRSADDRQLAAMRTPILARLAKIKRKKPKASEAGYWERLRLLHAPTDPADEVSSEALEAFKAQAKTQKKKSTRDPTLGLDCKAHKLDGFLVDIKKLD